MEYALRPCRAWPGLRAPTDRKWMPGTEGGMERIMVRTV